MDTSPLWVACLALFWTPCSTHFWAPCGSTFFLLDMNLNHEICVSLSALFAIILRVILGLFFHDKHILGPILELFFHEKHLHDSQVSSKSFNVSMPSWMLSYFFMIWHLWYMDKKSRRIFAENEGNMSFTWTIICGIS